ncbi:hypothetical protein [Enterococcus faecalis]|uniref:hypothetical protein n=1 Tax=Enterococcus faecalis TaxID=1351 RepID=UPI0030C8ABFE
MGKKLIWNNEKRLMEKMMVYTTKLQEVVKVKRLQNALKKPGPYTHSKLPTS